MLDRSDTGQVGFMKGEMQNRWDAGQVGCRLEGCGNGGMREWRDAGKERFKI